MVLTVTSLTRYIKSIIEGDEHLTTVLLEGEISNFTNHRATGHFYFSLKDDGAVIQAVMFRSSAAHVDFAPQNGMKVLVKGRISLYEKSGQYQIYVTQMQPTGLGDLHVAFEKLKKQLFEEGLFDKEHKLPIPRYPQNIGVITSKTGAALQDILTVLRRRYPIATVYVYPALVQGDGAADSVIKALDYFENHRIVDVIIMGRGGGSIEDLWAFNEEKLARKIYSLTIPVISAVGHEIDVTISDYVADLRAPTPSAGAEVVAPDVFKLKDRLENASVKMRSAIRSKSEKQRHRLEALLARRGLSEPQSVFDRKRQLLDNIVIQLSNSAQADVANVKGRIALLASRLEAISPISVMTRGYSVALSEGRRVVSVNDIEEGGNLELLLKDGTADCTVNTIREN